jgi:hypothetical protein
VNLEQACTPLLPLALSAHRYCLPVLLPLLAHCCLHTAAGVVCEILAALHAAAPAGLCGIENLQALTWLSVSECELVNDSDRYALSALTGLHSLDLSGTKVTHATLPCLLPLTALTRVCLDGCTKVWLIAPCVRSLPPCPLCCITACGCTQHSAVKAVVFGSVLSRFTDPEGARRVDAGAERSACVG